MDNSGGVQLARMYVSSVISHGSVLEPLYRWPNGMTLSENGEVVSPTTEIRSK